MIFGWGFPRALPKAMLTMAVGQLWCGGAPDPGLRPGLSENGHSGLNRKHTLGTNQTDAATALWPDEFRG